MPPEGYNEPAEETNLEPLCCSDCDEELTTHDVDYGYTNDEGNEICESCSEDYVECYESGDVIHIDDAYYSDNVGEYFSQDAYDDRFRHCEDCDSEIDTEYGDYDYCDDTGEYYCDSCNPPNRYPEWYVNDELTSPGVAIPEYLARRVEIPTTGDGRAYRTEDEHRWIVPNTYNKIPSKRHVGIEIEHYNSLDDSYEIGHMINNTLMSKVNPEYRVHYEHSRDTSGQDGSLNRAQEGFVGSEVDMKPRRGDYLWREIAIITDTIKREADGYVDVSCGQHMHFDARDLDWYHRVVIAGIVKTIEPHLCSMLPPSRRNNRYCQPMSQAFYELNNVRDRDDFIDYWYDTNRYSDSRWNDKRYYGLNMHPGLREDGIGSIEIRYHNGTLNKTKMRAWAIFWTTLIDYAKEIANELYEEHGSALSKQFLLTPGVLTGDEHIFRSLEKVVYRADRVLVDGEYDFDTFENTCKKLKEKVHIKEYRQMIALCKTYAEQQLGFSDKSADYCLNEAMKSLLEILRRRWNPVMNMPALMSSMDLPTWVVEHYRERSLDRLGNRHTPERHLEFCHKHNHGSVYIDRDTKKLTAHSLMIDRIELALYETGTPYFYFNDRLSSDWYHTSFFNVYDGDYNSDTESEVVFRRINFEGQYNNIVKYLESTRDGYAVHTEEGFGYRHPVDEDLDLPF